MSWRNCVEEREEEKWKLPERGSAVEELPSRAAKAASED